MMNEVVVIDKIIILITKRKKEFKILNILIVLVVIKLESLPSLIQTLLTESKYM